MKVREIMTRDPVTCPPEARLEDVARLMMERDCGAIPIVQNSGDGIHPMGIVTDRDIVMRTLAKGEDPMGREAREAMTEAAVTVSEDASLEECAVLMEENQIRRLLVVDANDNVVGMVSQADIALRAPGATAGEILEEISKPTQGSRG